MSAENEKDLAGFLSGLALPPNVSNEQIRELLSDGARLDIRHYSGQGSALCTKAGFDSLEALFEGNLIIDGQKGYIPVGKKCRSLGGLLVKSDGAAIESYRNFKNKHRLRLRFKVGGQILAPNLTSSKAYELHAKNELDKVNKNIADSSELLLHIGLARAFPDVPNRCYLQVNGLSVL